MSIISAITHQLPAVYINVIQWQLPEHVQNNLADPEFCKPGNIDLLLEAELFFDLLGNEQVKVNNQLVTIRNTKLGWIVSGRVNQAQRPVPSMCLLSSIYNNDDKPSTLCNEAVECEEHFRSTYTRNKEGRFSLKLPIKDKSILGSSYDMARRRFFSLEKRLSQDNELRSRYIIFLQEYEALGHMSQIKNVDAVHTNCYYLPHHAVLRAESLTTKTRVVFDASAKTTSGKSLNDMLMNGGVVQDDLVSILLRFRMHRFVMTADIEKMYRQILIDQEHRNYQRILWRDSPEKELLHFQLNTVTYGTTSAPFQATRCLQELANINKAKHPQAAQVIRQDFYVDDLITGSHSISRCQEIQREVTMILHSAGMTLRKWCANSPQLLVNIANTNDDPHVMLELNDNDTTKTLGLVWNPRDDQLLFKVSPHAKGHLFTKRTLLADLNRVFDPLGFLAPVLISGKIFIQQLWQLQLDWDTVLPADMSQRWYNYTNELCQIDQLKVVRKVKDHPCNSFELHGFCDASMNAYGACIYVRQLQPDNTFTCHLLIAKARVAPLKALSIPRLELCSAHVLATLMAKVRRTLDVSSNCCTCWTDSSVALTWIRGISSQWSTFVANRVSEIQTLTEEMTWQHVRTKFNPANLPSRGVKVQDLLHSNLWWYGPTFLQQPKTEVPAECSSAPSSELLEKRPVQFALLVQTQENSILTKYSSWTKLIRITAYLTRFIHNTRQKGRDRLIGPLSVTELKTARDVWIKIAQTEAFYDEVKSLKQGKSLSSHSKLITLSPFLEEGIIRVGGRLQRSHLPINQRHPAILPKKHTVTELIFTEYHIKYLHAGPQNLLTRVRQEFWPLDAMKTARRIVHCCQICYRARPQSFQPSMGELPRLRVTPSRPFTATGVDFAGPIQIYSGPRNRTVTKAYIAVFVCFSTRAIHLEAVSNLSAQAFLAALRRFFARRGQSAHIHSDNGTNFHGARAELRRYYTEHCQNNKTIIESLATDGTEWHFNPPSAPHMGGLWEAAVKSTKHHLLRITGSAKLNFEELTTMLCQIEACLNSRPLTAQSSDPESFAVLTPAHFLVGGC